MAHDVIFPQRLRLARKRAGLSMRALSERMSPKVTAQAISRYEAGKMLPSSAVLVALAKALGVSLDFLMSAQVQTLEGLEFRKHSGASARDRARAEATFIDNLERYLTIETILDLHPTTEWVRRRRYDSVASESEIDEKADSLRDFWDLGMDPIPSLCVLLEEKGIKVVEDDLPESVNGLGCHVVRDGEHIAEAVIVSGRINLERKRFTLAHELAHRIIRSTGNPAIRLENAMNRFAGAFLMPERHLVEAVGGQRNRITYYEIVRLKHLYGVSAAALLVRLGQLEILPPATVRRAFSTYARTWRKVEPAPIGNDSGFAAFEKPHRFQHLVLRAVGEELISPVRAATLLGRPLEYVEGQISGPSFQ